MDTNLTLEKKVKELEQRMKILWNAIEKFKIEIDNCECGCCPGYAKIDIPIWNNLEI